MLRHAAVAVNARSEEEIAIEMPLAVGLAKSARKTMLKKTIWMSLA